MKPIEGRLQTGQHILARIIENKIDDAKVVIAKYREDSGLFEVSTQADLRKLEVKKLEKETNKIIKKELLVNKIVYKREEIESEFDLSKIPDSVKKIRIIEISDFDKRPCGDPHVDNTKEIGSFEILKIERVGKDRYRFMFRVK